MAIHREVCLEWNDKQATKTPEKGIDVQYTEHYKQLKAHFLINADFKPNLKNNRKNNRNNSIESYIDKWQDHIVSYYVYEIVCVYDTLSEPV